jgi:hypothetical protein
MVEYAVDVQQKSSMRLAPAIAAPASAAMDRPAVSGTPRLPIGPATTVRKKM